MRSAWNRTLSTAAGCILVLLLSGCNLVAFTYLCDSSEKKCSVLIYSQGSQNLVCYNDTSEGGCITVPIGCDAGSYCGLEASALYSICTACNDPILAEWPDSWTVTSAQWFRAFPPPLSGQVLIEPAENFDLPEGAGPVVTDPGYSAHVLRLDVVDIPLDTYQIRIEFERDDLTPMCAKGVEVALVTFEPGNFRFISPLPGESLDLTSYDAPDPHVLCMDGATPVRPLSWGLIKSVYR